MSSRQINITQGTPEWHSWRKTLLTASDVPAILNKSPYKTARDLWFEKSGFGEDEPDESTSRIFRMGHEAEAEIRDLFLKQTKIEMKPTCFENDERFGASLDGYDKRLGILEAKLVGKDVLERAISTNEIPEHHAIQIQTQLFVSESDKAFWGAKAPKVKDGVVVEIGRNEKLIKEIRAQGIKFWESINSGKAPELSERDTLFITDPEQQELFRRLESLKISKDTIDAEYEKIEKEIKSLATHPKVKCLGVTVTDVERAGSIDYLKIPELKALAQEYIEKFRKSSSTYKKITFKVG